MKRGPQAGISGRNPSLIKADKASNALEYLAYLLFFIIELFAINNFNLYIAIIGLTSLMMLVVARLIQPKASTPKSPSVYASKTTEAQGNSIILGVFFAIGLFVAYYIAAPGLFGLPEDVFSQLATVSLTTALSIDTVYSILQAIAEERFFRYAIVNGIAYYVKGQIGVYLAIIGSALIFWLFHEPIYYNNVTAQGLILVSGAGLALVDFYYHRLIISTLGHMIWNGIVVLRPLVFPMSTASPGASEISIILATGISLASYAALARGLR